MVFIFLEYEELKRSKEAMGLGYKHFFQNQVGNVLMNHGLKLATVFWTELAAIKVTSFMHSLLARRRVEKIRKARCALPRQSLVEHGITSDKGHNNMQWHCTTNGLLFEI